MRGRYRIIRLQDANMNTLRDVCRTLAEFGITLDSATTEDIASRTEWTRQPVWLAYATRLGRSRVMYFLPDMYDALAAATGVDCVYHEAYSGDVAVRIVGVLDGEQPLGPFWDKNLKLPEEASRARRCLDFGRALQNLGLDDTRCLRWNLADIDIRDLNNTEIVRIALAYLWRSEDKSLTQLALDAINPDYGGGCDQLFTEWITVHLRTNSARGWALDIPVDFKTQWNDYKQSHLGRLDLNVTPRGVPPTVVRIRRNWKGEILQDCDVYIGRAVHRGGWDLPCSDWNNPFPRHIPLERYEKYLREERPDLMARLPELYGKRLGCWCKPELCHGDVLVYLIKRSMY